MADLEAMAADVVKSAQQFVARAVAGIGKRVDDLAAACAALGSRIDGLPAPAKGDMGQSAYEIAFARGFKGDETDWLESLRGKDAEIVDVPRLVADAVALIPKAKDGENAEIDYERVGEMVKAMVGAAVSALPTPAPGKDADPVDLQRLAVDAAALVPSKEIDYVQIGTLVSVAVDEAVAALPPAKQGEPGKDVDPAEVERAVAAAVSAIPKPKDAEPVDYERVAAMLKTGIAEAVAAIPAPKDGKSVEPEVVREMVATEVASAVAALPAPKPGKDAEPIHPDTVALMVATEVAKAIERAVATLPAPKNGDPGRDALQVDILPAIDEAKSYPRGTFARHRGGLVHSFRDTAPVTDKGIELAGWSVVVQGIADISVTTADDLRSGVISISKTGGEVIEHRMTLPVVIYRGVYREGEAYAKGDSATWGGSTWVAMKDTTSKPDSGDGSWILSNKKGRDGKDLTPPAPRDPVVKLR